MSFDLTRIPRASTLVPIFSAAILVAAFTLIVNISVASLVFSGDLSAVVGYGIGLYGIGGLFITLIGSLTSSYPGTVIGSQDGPAALASLLAASVVAKLGSIPVEEKLPTVLAALVIGTVVVGAVMLLIGGLRWAHFVRFIPFPVIGGFLAGTGWLLLTGGIGVMTLSPLDATLFQPDMLLRWLPGFALAFVLVALTRRVKHFLTLHTALLVAVVLFYAALLLTGTSIESAEQIGLLVGALPQGSLWQPPVGGEFGAINWALIASEAGTIASMVIVSIVALLLNASGLELVVQQDFDMNRELRGTGLANLVGGALGAGAGYHGLSHTVLAYRVGVNSRAVGVIAAVLMGVIIVAGAPLLGFIPRMILGGLVSFVGLDFLVDWVWVARKRLPRTDYALILVILGVVAVFGYLQGVAVGLVAAAVLFIVEYSRLGVVRHELTAAECDSRVLRPPEDSDFLVRYPYRLHVLELQGFIFFGTAHAILSRVRARLARDDVPAPSFIVLDFRRVQKLDSSAASVLARLTQLTRKYGVTLVLTSLTTPMLDLLRLTAVITSDNSAVRVFSDYESGVEYCENALLAGTREMYAVTTIHQQLRTLLPGVANIEAAVGFMRCVTLAMGDVLAQQGDATREVFFIESGRISARLQLPGGTMRLRSAGAGTVLGEISFYTGGARTASLVADAPSVVYSLSSDEMTPMREADPALYAAMHEALANVLARRLADTTRQLEAVMR